MSVYLPAEVELKLKSLSEKYQIAPYELISALIEFMERENMILINKKLYKKDDMKAFL